MKTKELYRFRPVGLTETLTDSFGIEIYFSEKDLRAIFYAGKSAKSWWYYQFRSLNEMIENIYKSVDNHIKNETEKLERKEREKIAMAEFKASDYYQIGDVIYSSWGYEQTNVDFYQVIEVLNKKIRVREIGCTRVDELSDMSCEVIADKDNFLNDVIITFSLKLEVNTNGKKSRRICRKNTYQWFDKWDGRPKYMSWYY